jgi:hypothetical protein
VTAVTHGLGGPLPRRGMIRWRQPYVNSAIQRRTEATPYGAELQKRGGPEAASESSEDECDYSLYMPRYRAGRTWAWLQL